MMVLQRLQYIYNKAIETFPESTLVQTSILVNDDETVLVIVPTLDAQIFELRKSHVGINVVVVHMLEVQIVLFE